MCFVSKVRKRNFFLNYFHREIIRFIFSLLFFFNVFYERELFVNRGMSYPNTLYKYNSQRDSSRVVTSHVFRACFECTFHDGEVDAELNCIDGIRRDQVRSSPLFWFSQISVELAVVRIRVNVHLSLVLNSDRVKSIFSLYIFHRLTLFELLCTIYKNLSSIWNHIFILHLTDSKLDNCPTLLDFTVLTCIQVNLSRRYSYAYEPFSCKLFPFFSRHCQNEKEKKKKGETLRNMAILNIPLSRFE